MASSAQRAHDTARAAASICGERARIVTQAAVIGRTFWLQLLASVAESEPEALLPALRRARDFQLIEELEPDVFRFRHGLTREAICGNFLQRNCVRCIAALR